MVLREKLEPEPGPGPELLPLTSTPAATGASAIEADETGAAAAVVAGGAAGETAVSASIAPAAAPVARGPVARVHAAAVVAAREADLVDAVTKAAQEGNVEELKRLRVGEADSVPVDATNSDGMTALHIAGLYGRLEAVQYLLQRGATVDVPTNYKATALHCAASNGHAAVAQELALHSSWAEEYSSWPCTLPGTLTTAKCAHRRATAVTS